eukprot:444761_1
MVSIEIFECLTAIDCITVRNGHISIMVDIHIWLFDYSNSKQNYFVERSGKLILEYIVHLDHICASGISSLPWSIKRCVFVISYIIELRTITCIQVHCIFVITLNPNHFIWQYLYKRSFIKPNPTHGYKNCLIINLVNCARYVFNGKKFSIYGQQ